MLQYDCLVVGQGLAGTVLGHCLEQRGLSVVYVDDHHQSASTKAAAGLINPITGRLFVKSWLVEELLVTAREIYSQLAQRLGVKLWQDLDIRRALHTIKQCNQWSERLIDVDYDDFARQANDFDVFEGHLQACQDIAQILNGARVDIASLITEYQSMLISKGRLQTETFAYERLHIDNGSVRYGDITAKRIFFAEGYKVLDNPYFQEVEMRPAKGESIQVHIPSVNTTSVAVKHKQFLVPLGGEMYWSGGGFDKQYVDDKPSAIFMDKYKASVSEFVLSDHSFVEHRAGVRPCVKDRRPVIGTHTHWSNVHIFNGMGTKGTSLAPFFAHNLISHIYDAATLMPEVNWRRFAE